MEWRLSYLDVILVPLGLMISMGYHLWLCHKIRTQPLATVIGTTARARRSWVSAVIKDNEKKNILAVQTLRNTIMGSTLMATTSILLCTALAAVISSSYRIKKPLRDSVYGAHGEFMVALKYVTLLVLFLSSFVCHALSVRFANQVSFLINCAADGECVAELLERGVLLHAAGNRVFYSALPMLLWIFGPVMVFLGSVAMVAVLYNLDLVSVGETGKVEGENVDCVHCVRF